MQFGDLLILFSLLAVVYSTWNYFQASQQLGRNGNARKMGNQEIMIIRSQIGKARYGFYAIVALVTAASVYLLYLILTHQFQFEYVARYSSRSLPLGYLVSAFWAGQEGSFLIWVFFIAWLGLPLIRMAKSLETEAMITVNVIIGIFLLILLKASPFTMMAQVPADGSGLNPLLQNPWMVVHPPVLFLGYAAITFPFALAMAAMIRRKYDSFVDQALPWSLFSSITLGAGIIIGAYWAYMVLGWGGYWGWDPVENSSLIPWLAILALFHGLILQKRHGNLPKVNLTLAIAAFALVLYATFLTRSGVLADFSVHSFEDLGINLYLILFIAGALGAGYYLLYLRKDELSGPGVNLAGFNREAIIWGSMIVFTASAVLTLVGTSSPILTGFIGDPAQVDISFYNIVHYPIGIAIGLLLGLAPVLRWRNEDFSLIAKRLAPAVILTVLSLAAIYYGGMTRPGALLFVGSAFFALWSNSIVAVKNVRIHQRHVWAPLSHVGLAIMLVAIMAAAYFEKNERVLLTKETPQEVLGYQMTYKGKAPAANGKDLVFIEVANGDIEYTAQPRFYYSNYNRALMREPDVQEHLLYDMYISPLQLTTPEDQKLKNSALIIRKGEQKPFRDLQVRFMDFDMSNHSESKVVRVGASLEIIMGDKTYPLTPAIAYEDGKKASQPAKIKLQGDQGEFELSISLDGLDVSQKAIQLGFSGFPEPAGGPQETPEQLLVEVSLKPFMSALWIGTIIFTLATIMALWNRYTNLNHPAPKTKEKNYAEAKKLLNVSN